MASEMTAPGGATLDEVVGLAFARALAEHDFVTLGSLLDSEVEFRALTPRRTWEVGRAVRRTRDADSAPVSDARPRGCISRQRLQIRRGVS